jgi:carbamate kinase
VRAVIALGGNALLRRGEPPDDERQRRNIAAAASAVARIAREHAVVVTHGNGPQVGLLALQAEAYDPRRAQSLDVLGAQTEGMIGYLIEQELRNRLPGRQVATLLTQVAVDACDPAFAKPTKPIGPVYSKQQAERLAGERGWNVAPDGDAYRRVVPSPAPQRIIELETIRLLLEAGVLVVCAGGGGIPVVETPSGGLRGIEAVIDKDRAAALLASALAADALLLLTDVDAVYADWGAPGARPLRRVTPDEIRRHTFEPGSMGPKVEAACRFVEATGGTAGIGSLEDAEAILAGRSGTIVQPPRRT